MDGQNGDDAESVIQAFLQAAVRPELWSAALQKLANIFEADGCALIGGPSASIDAICTPSLHDTAGIGSAEDYFGMQEILLALESAQGIVVGSTIPSLELVQRQRNVEWINQTRPRWFVAMTLVGTGPSSIVLTLVRNIKAQPFSQWEIELLRRIGPQLRKAGNLALRLTAIHHEGLLKAFVTINCGAILLDRKGRVLHMSNKAEALMHDVLTVRDGFLTADVGESDAVLQALIRCGLARPVEFSARRKDGIALFRPSGRPLLIHTAPLPISPGDQLRHACCVLTIVDPTACHLPAPSDLRELFGLTNSEAAIAVELCLGRDLDEIATMREVTTSTLRVQLKRILFKTGTRRQPELVALLLRYFRLSAPDHV